MNFFTSNRLAGWLIALLILLNVALLITAWYPKIFSNTDKGDTGTQIESKKGAEAITSPVDKDNKKTGKIPAAEKDKKIIDNLHINRLKKEREERSRRIAGFLQQELGFNAAQVTQFQKLRKEHFEKVDVLQRQIDDLRKQMMDQLLEAKPDKGAAKLLAQQMGLKLAELEISVFNHFLDLMEICNEDQQQNYLTFMRKLLPQLAPPGGNRNGGPLHETNNDPGFGPGRVNNRPQTYSSNSFNGNERQDNRPPTAREGDTPMGGQNNRFRQQGMTGRSGMPGTGRQGQQDNTQGFESLDRSRGNQPPQGRSTSPGEGGGRNMQGGQGQAGRNNGEDPHLRRLIHELQLTSEQTTKIRTILEESRQKLEKIRYDSSYTTHEERRKAVETIHQSEDSQIEKLLTDDQKKRYQQIKQQRPSDGGQKGMPGNGNQGGRRSAGGGRR